MIRSEKMRGLINTIAEHAGLQALLGGSVARNTLSNALSHRDLEQMVEAWMLTLQVYGRGWGGWAKSLHASRWLMPA